LPLIERAVPDVRIIVAGRYPTEKIRRLGKRKNVLVEENVPDIIPYYQKSKVSIVPLRAGGGSRLKILESMALGRPVVSTAIGAKGLRVINQENIIIADSPLNFAQGVIRLLQDKDLRDTISRSAREMVESNYDWSVISRKLMTLYGKSKA
jgi:glycosyltransferase involved in cell wall biosynthesis